jgi:hypothetical protein
VRFARPRRLLLRRCIIQPPEYGAVQREWESIITRNVAAMARPAGKQTVARKSAWFSTFWYFRTYIDLDACSGPAAANRVVHGCGGSDLRVAPARVPNGINGESPILFASSQVSGMKEGTKAWPEPGSEEKAKKRGSYLFPGFPSSRRTHVLQASARARTPLLPAPPALPFPISCCVRLGLREPAKCGKRKVCGSRMTSIATEWNTRGQSVAKQLIIPPCSLANPRSWVWEAGWAAGITIDGRGGWRICQRQKGQTAPWQEWKTSAEC